MKTLNDLFELSILQVELNKGKLLNYHVIINTSFNWVCVHSTYTNDDGEIIRERIIEHMMFNTPEQLQACYWVIYNKVRTK